MDNNTRKGKSTHQGHCQACGRLQMLPNNRLSLHGYTVTHGYFSGVCVGSKEQPFEKSCELVKLFIANAKQALANVTAFQADLRDTSKTVEGKAWVMLSKAHPRGHYYGRQSAGWREVNVRMTTIPYSDGTGSRNEFHHDGDTAWKRQADGRSYAIEPVVSEIQYQYGKTLLEVCQAQNAIYARWLQHEVDSLTRYIAWQTERVANWKEEELTPLSGPIKDDKKGFKVTEAPY